MEGLDAVVEQEYSFGNSHSTRYSFLDRLAAGFTLAAIAVQILASAPARAEKPSPAADEITCAISPECYYLGKKAYDLQEYRRAGQLWERAYKLLPSESTQQATVLLYNLAQNYEAAGWPELALRYYTLFLADLRGGKGTIRDRGTVYNTEQMRAFAEEKIPPLELYARGLQRSAEGNYQEAVELLSGVDQHGVPNSPGRLSDAAHYSLTRDLGRAHAGAGNHQRAIDLLREYQRLTGGTAWDSEDVAQQIGERENEMAQQRQGYDNGNQTPLPAETPSPERELPLAQEDKGLSTRSKVALGLGSLGAALAAAGGWFLKRAHDERQRADYNCTGAECADASERIKKYNAFGIGGLASGAAAAMAAGGIALWGYRSPTPGNTGDNPNLQPLLGDDHKIVGVGVGGKF